VAKCQKSTHRTGQSVAASRPSAPSLCRALRGADRNRPPRQSDRRAPRGLLDAVVNAQKSRRLIRRELHIKLVEQVRESFVNRFNESFLARPAGKKCCVPLSEKLIQYRLSRLWSERAARPNRRHAPPRSARRAVRPNALPGAPGFAPSVRQLGAHDGALSLAQPHNPGQRLDLSVVPEAQVNGKLLWWSR